MLDLAIVIVTWNVHDLIVDALRSLYEDLATTNLTYTVMIVDSASSDDSVTIIQENFPQVQLIASIENLGFGKANNLALQQLGFGDSGQSKTLPKAVYLLNPDTITHQGATQALFDALMENPRVGLVGAQLEYEDGSFQHSAFEFPGLGQLWVEFFPTPGRFIEGSFNGRYPRSKYASGEPFPVDFVLGATMMLRAEVIEQTGMFDATFFMYCEEIDWAWRIQKAGWQIYCVPQARITHFSGKSTSQIRTQSMVNLWTSRLQLFNKYFPIWKKLFARKLVALGMKRKIQQAKIMPPSKYREDLIEAYQQIVNQADHSA